MARVISISGSLVLGLEQDWELAATKADEIANPELLDRIGTWLTAPVPGTVALALKRAGQWTLNEPEALHHNDYWYRTWFQATGRQTLRFAGLATCAEVWLNGELILRSDNMFVGHRVDVTLIGRNQLCICFRSLTTLLAKPMKRARWRPAMIVPPTLRSVRTTLLGHMPGWCPAVHAIGPWRPVELVDLPVRVVSSQLRAELRGDATGILQVTLTVSGVSNDSVVSLVCAGSTVPMTWENEQTLHAKLSLESIQAWWPHTHGGPQRYAVQAKLGETVIELGKVGFRRIEVDRGAEGRNFALMINGVRVFCRGACWTSADIVGLAGTREVYLPWLEQMRAANMNMVRVGGTMVYEGNDFYELCDELGLLVWQDFMFANFDYPITDAAFASSVRIEVEHFLDRTQVSPSIAVLCGGSEVAQQAAMLGLPPDSWRGPLFDNWLPELCARFRPDVPYVANSPGGGDLPFIANHGVTHYYGVGAYMRPLDDARRAEVQFASECLAFANVPEASTLQRELPVPAVHHPLWKQRLPRDNGASWDFEDVRDHYLALLYKVDPVMLRRTEPERYLSLSRAITGEVMESVFAEWRRKRSPTAGGLVWNYQDLWPGAGWGVVDSLGEPKAAWYALRRAFRPLQVALTDEGVNGLAVHVINDGAMKQSLRLNLACWHEQNVIVNAVRELIVNEHSALEFSSAELLERFFDINYVYRFGSPAHEVTVATLIDAANGELLAEAFHFPLGYDIHRQPLDWQVRIEQIDEQWYVCIKVNRFATSVHIVDDHYRAEDNWFHLLPNVERRVLLVPRHANTPAPDGEVSSLNCLHAARYRSVN